MSQFTVSVPTDDGVVAKRTWQVNVSVGTVKQCRELLDVDLCDVPANFDLLQKIRSDDALLANILYVCCRDQAEALAVSDEDFGKMLVGGVIEDAEESFWESLAFFFRGGRRQQLERALAIQKQLETSVLDQLTPERQKTLVDRAGKAAGRTIDELLKEADFTGNA